MGKRRSEKKRGFTLVELLVVVLIVVLVSAATLPVVIPAITHRQVSEGARILQAAIAGARDAAIRTNAPRGIRLLPDPAFPGPSPLAANRMVSIESAPDYTSGAVSINQPQAFPYTDPISGNPYSITQLRIHESVFSDPAKTLPNEPTSWYWNIRQGDRIRFDDSGRYYTIAGPMLNGVGQGNSERYINYGPPGYVDLGDGSGASVQNDPDPTSANHHPEYLIVVNGQDDNGNGWVDEAFDGIDNDGDGVIDPGFDGVNNNPVYNYNPNNNLHGEFETETFIGNQFGNLGAAPLRNQKYTILRRPIVSEAAREVALPQGVVVDLTTWNAATTVGFSGIAERSRLPVDPFTLYVDVMLSPNGQVLIAGPGQATPGGGGNNSPVSSLPFYHFWLAEREDVYDTIWQKNGASNTGSAGGFAPYANPAASNPPASRLTYLLPMPKGTANYAGPAPDGGPYLKGDRRLVTLFVKSGLVVTNAIETFNGGDIGVPYYSAQIGTRQTE